MGKEKGKRSNLFPDEVPASPATLQLPALLEAIEGNDIHNVILLYQRLLDASHDEPPLKRAYTWLLARCLHEAIRRNLREVSDEVRRDGQDRLIAFAEQLVKDIKKGRLSPDLRAHGHLLGLFKESGVHDAGRRFWDWLRAQDDAYVAADIYGVAIELLSADGVPLSELEELFEEGLTRSSANFAAYHLSPNAIVPSRELPTTIKGLPMGLLRGILTARVTQGNPRDAYLALDIALRLYPITTPSRAYATVMEERPLMEGYTILAMACRAGSPPTLGATRQIITALGTSTERSSPSGHVQAIRAALSVWYLYGGAGGAITPNLVNGFVIMFTGVLRVQGFAEASRADKERVVERVLRIVRHMLELFARYGAEPRISAFNSIIINVAGYGQSRRIIDVALKDAQSLGLTPTSVTHRSILSAAGMLGDVERLKTSWAALLQARRASGEQLDESDFHMVIKAARLCDQVDWATTVCRDLSSHLSPEARQPFYDHLGKTSDTTPATDPVNLDIEHLLTELDKVQADLKFIDEQTTNGTGHQDFSAQRLPMTLLPPSDEATLPESELRALYDEVTTEPGQPVHEALVQGEQPIGASLRNQPLRVSLTNMSVGSLRYENWKTINYLLKCADKTEQQYIQAVDEAISVGNAPPPRAMGFDFGTESKPSYGLSDLAKGEGEGVAKPNVVTEPEDIERLKGEILRLRGISPRAR